MTDFTYTFRKYFHNSYAHALFLIHERHYVFLQLISKFESILYNYKRNNNSMYEK